MSDTIHGLCSAVRAQALGDAISVAVTLGDTVINVYDVADFDEDGGWLWYIFGGAVVLSQYTAIDDDACTITIPASPAIHTLVVDTEISVWDAANGQPAVRYLATIDSLDGFDGDPVEAVVDQHLVHALAQTARDGKGESVTLVRDGSELQVAKVHGRNSALASLQYLQGGMTTRQNDTDSGVDILGVDSGTPGVYVYGDGDDGNRIVLRTDGSAGILEFWTGATGETNGQINPGIDGSGNHFIDLLTSKAASPHNNAAHVRLQGSGAGSSASLNMLGTFLDAGDIDASGDVTVAGNIGVTDLSATGFVTANGSVTGSTMHGSGTLQTDSGFFDNSLVGGGSSTASINNSGHIVRTSTKKMKKNIKAMKAEEARSVLGLISYTAEYRTPKGEHADPRRYPVFIAEQGAEAGAELWVGRQHKVETKDGKKTVTRDVNGEITSFRTAEVTVAHNMILRDHDGRTESLEAENAAQEARIEKLEALVAALTKEG